TVQVRVPKGVVVRLHSGAPALSQQQNGVARQTASNPAVADLPSVSLRFCPAADQSRFGGMGGIMDWLTWRPRMLSILRIMTGLLFLQHGLAKIVDFPHQQNHVPWAMATLNPGVQGLLELVGGVLLALGLFTRPVAFILAGDMAVAYFMRHAPQNFFPLLNGGELAVLYCFVFLYLWIAGGGVWSLDRLWSREASSPLAAGSRA